MLSKKLYPTLNREARRHPDRYLSQFNYAGKPCGNWLINGLIARLGLATAMPARVDLPPAAMPFAINRTRQPGKSWLQRLWQVFNA